MDMTMMARLQLQHRRHPAVPPKRRALVALIIIFASVSGIPIFFYGASNTKLLDAGVATPPLLTCDGASALAKSRSSKSIVLFFSVVCTHCRNQLANLTRLFPKYASRIVFLTLSSSDQAQTRRFVSQNRFPFSIFQGNKDSIYNFQKIPGVPALFLIDENGSVKLRPWD
jgi:hypothetical protein